MTQRTKGAAANTAVETPPFCGAPWNCPGHAAPSPGVPRVPEEAALPRGHLLGLDSLQRCGLSQSSTRVPAPPPASSVPSGQSLPSRQFPSLSNSGANGDPSLGCSEDQGAQLRKMLRARHS